MDDAYTLTNARSRLGELVNRARFGRERVILTEHGTPVAAIISVEELAELQAAVDAADIAAAAAVKATGESGIPHENVLAVLDALDAADLAGSAEQAEAILAPHAGVLARANAAARSGQAW
ncbi:MAG: type II toxin-antitoxin system Phd/YefM family antitoxin [Dermatophilaceae bacterium]